MHWLGFSLNLLSLLAFAVVIGVLVDDAIVEIENIAQHRAMGKSREQAAIDAADEIGIAVIATSATLTAVFVPVAFMPGEIGLYFREFGWTAAVAVLFSLLVARLLTPMLASRYLGTVERPHIEPRWMPRYLTWVEAALRHRGRTVVLALGTFVAALALVPLIPTTFLPPMNESRTDLQITLPPGVRLSETVAAAERVRTLLRDIPELEMVFAKVGTPNLGGYDAAVQADVRKASLTLEFADQRKRTIQELESDVRHRLRDMPGVRVNFAAQGPGDRLDIVLAGKDSQQLAAAGQKFEAALRTIPGLGSVSSTASLLNPEIVIVPDAARAADLGVSTVDIAAAARIATSGDFRRNLAKLNLAERQIPIRVKVSDSSLSDAALLYLLRIPERNGSVPLSAVATISNCSRPAQIERYNRERNIKISAELNGLPLGNVMASLRKMPATTNLPPGVRIVPSGDAEAFGEMFLGFAMAMLAGIGSVYLVLVLLFGSAVQPLVILAAVPLCGAGAFGALLLTGHALSLPSLIGLLMLTGVSTKNSILIVDYAIIGERDQGLSRHDAIIAACRKRARPVIMTTLAMGAGMLPVAFALSADGNFRGAARCCGDRWAADLNHAFARGSPGDVDAGRPTAGPVAGERVRLGAKSFAACREDALRAGEGLRAQPNSFAAAPGTGAPFELGDLEQHPLALDPLEGMAAVVVEAQARTGDQVAHGSGDEHLAGAGEAHHARADVDCNTTDFVADLFALAGVQAGPHVEAERAHHVADR
jgi:multidrug efflux pump subunit AcrB